MHARSTSHSLTCLCSWDREIELRLRAGCALAVTGGSAFGGSETGAMNRSRLALQSVGVVTLLATLVVVAALVLGDSGARGGRASARARSPAGERLRVPAAGPFRVLSIVCHAPSLGGRMPAEVYLPPGYGTTRRRYPVVYFLHGLPANPDSYRHNSFVAGALLGAGQRALVVAPQGARSKGSDREYLDWSPTEDWPRAITYNLTSCVDHRFRTIASRRGRALIGLSAGGYGALNIGLRNLQTFSAVEAWSGYIAATDPSGWHLLSFPSAVEQRNATIPDNLDLRAEMRRYPALIGFYCGRADDRFAGTNEQLNRTLDAGRIWHVYRTYPGGHSGALWRAQAPKWLSLALTYLRTGRRPRSLG